MKISIQATTDLEPLPSFQILSLVRSSCLRSRTVATQPIQLSQDSDLLIDIERLSELDNSKYNT
jgi:hypothetical protein